MDITQSALLFASLLVLSVPASAQTPASPPDFSGLWKRIYVIDQTFDPAPNALGQNLPSPIVQDPRYPRTNSNGVLRLPIADDERESVIGLTQNWIPDVTNPILQPGTRVALEEIARQELAGIPHPQPQTQCLPSGAPLILNTARAISILQTPTEVIFLYSRDHHVRHVYLNQKHSADREHTWWGDSVGHYEGDTLVIDTIGQTDMTDTDRFGTRHSEEIHVVERYRLSEDGGGIEVVFTVEDPIAFATPWAASAHFVPDDFMFLEIVCAENQREFWPGREIYFPTGDTPDF
jgi:hypothetical protein